MVEELEVPKKMFAISIAPHNAPMPSGVVLQKNQVIGTNRMKTQKCLKIHRRLQVPKFWTQKCQSCAAQLDTHP